MDDSANPDSEDYSGSAKIRKYRAIALLILLIGFGVLALLVFVFVLSERGMREASRRATCLVKMKRIAFALQNYAERHDGMLPPAYTKDADGKPLHSWRTLILPYMDEKELYDSIDLTKPWDDPVNEKALKTQVEAYKCPSTPSFEAITTYLAVVTPNSCFIPTEPRRLSDIAAEHSQVLMVIEVDEKHVVPWMKPVDADESVALGIGKDPASKSAHSGGVFNAVFVDAHGRGLVDNMPANQLRAMISVRPEDKVGLKMPE